jgi:hypothetical protein
MKQSEAKMLLKFVPNHTRTSCSDENVANSYTTVGRGGYPRCNRCALLKAVESLGYAKSLSVEHIDIKLPVLESNYDAN